MASTKFYFYFLLIALLAFNITPNLSANGAQQLIDKICRAMEEYAFCNNVFHQNIKGSNPDIVALAQITVEQSLNNATGTHSLITKLLGKPANPAQKNALTVCENAYRLVLGNLQEAAVDFFSKNYRGMLDAERKTPRALSSCIDIFNTPPSPPNPLQNANRQMRMLIAMAVATGSQLTTGSNS